MLSLSPSNSRRFLEHVLLFSQTQPYESLACMCSLAQGPCGVSLCWLEGWPLRS